MDGFGHGRSQPPPSPVSIVTSGGPGGLSSGGATVAPYYAPARSGFFLSSEDSHHFLDSCFLCKKPLTGNCDIFMYRGDMPFCSEVCRQEQIEIAEAREKKRTTTLKHQLSINQQDDEQRSSPSKSQKIEVRSTGTVVAG